MVVQEDDWRPASSSDRLAAIDIIRGLALFGVLVVNILSGFRVPLLEHIRAHFAGLQGTDYVVELLTSFALEFKAFTIFTFLFGVGIAIQFERATRRHVNARQFLLRRLAWLCVLGLAHLFLVWNGDILTLYAICGLLLITLLDLPSSILFLIGAALIALPEFISLGASLPSGPTAIADIARARQVYGNAGFLPILNFRWYESWSLIIPLLIMVLPRTTGLMCCGVAAWRSGILRTPQQHRGKLLATLTAGTLLGGALTANDVWAAASGVAPWPAWRSTHLDPSILLALGYVSGLLLWTPRRALLLPGIAALGQMALTNYLLQSIVLGGIFYGYGFGLLGRIGSAAAAGIGLVIYIAQVQLSRFWLRTFRFGPVEWLWRSLAYRRKQPMGGAPNSNSDVDRQVSRNMNWLTVRRLPCCISVTVPIVAFAAVHALLPWALSLLGARHGWARGRPDVLNVVGLIPIAVGFYIVFLCSREHFTAAPDGWLLEATPYCPSPEYLLTGGPYRYSSNPIYLAELAMWLGWTAFYGSFVIGATAMAAMLLAPVIVAREERGLEARFGDQYREYRRTTPRWLGNIGRQHRSTKP
jgi:uncharacterized protein